MFEDKVAIVTGASSGIGLAVAEKLVMAGAKVALVARTKSTLDAAVRRLGSDRAAAFALDVGDLDALIALPLRVKGHFGRLDIVVNNAGLNHRGAIDKHSAKALADIINVNLTAPIVLTRAASEHLETGGSVVFVASIAGMVPVPGEATYSASKAGMRAFSRAVQEDFAERSIHCGIVSPGPVDTGFFGDELDEVPDLVFSQPISSADQIADAVLACIERRKEEIAVPGQSGRLATFAYVFPEVAKALRPMLQKKGAKAKAAYIAKKRV
ncbi:MAG: SDR family NAD(P)-dependent oxidoreductase [Polyangiaceae bacterium]|nr:SDR family NAD(P)-dependent oxidoreductase [Polyangiaceae bacterium]